MMPFRLVSSFHALFLELSVLNLLVTLYQGLTDFSSIVRSFVSINYLVPVIISTLAALKVKKNEANKIIKSGVSYILIISFIGIFLLSF